MTLQKYTLFQHLYLTKQLFKSIGITAHAIKASTKVKIGDKINKNLFESSGNIVSLDNNFKPSAIGCKRPKGPTTLGPFLNCIEPMTFLSRKLISD